MKTLFDLKSAVLSLICFVFLSFGALQAAVVSSEATQIIFAGQSIEVGMVTSEVIGTDLVVTYAITEDGWEFTEAQMWIGTDTNDIPQTKKGNPKIGNFPYKSEDGELPNTFYSFTVSLDELGFSCPADDGVYFIAAHSSVQLTNDNGDVIQTETGWSEGIPFVDRGSWATYSTITLSCSVPESSPPLFEGGSCETAFAYGGSEIAKAFKTPTAEGNFQRWGWTNGELSMGYSETWPIYAGAGGINDDDLMNAALQVGTLTVDYDGTKMQIDYDINSSYYMEQIHLYVGAEILPRSSGQNAFTVAPGQYTIIDDQLVYSVMFSHTINDCASEDKYIIAHAVVCKFD